MSEFGDSRLPARFWERCAVSAETGCWTWNGAKHRYGITTVKGKQRVAHRVAYEALVGVVPSGLELDHLCRNRYCVNPRHLEPVTHYENIMRGEAPAAKLARKTHCKNGHSLESNTTRVYYHANGRPYRRCIACDLESRPRRNKLSPDSVREIRRCVSAGEGYRSIAARVGVSISNISLIVLGKAWAHVPDDGEV